MVTLESVLEVPIGHRYKLVATITHKGPNIKSGHNIAHMRTDAGQWVCCNDEITTRSSLQEASTADNYILLFKMIENDLGGLQVDVPCSPVVVAGDGDQNNQSLVQSPQDGSDNDSDGELPDIPYTVQHQRTTERNESIPNCSQVEKDDKELKEIMKMQQDLENILKESQPATSRSPGKKNLIQRLRN